MPTTDPTPAVKLVEVTLTATTVVTYTEIVEVPADATPEELNALANQVYTRVGANEFSVDSDVWERGDSRVVDAQVDAEPVLIATRGDHGLTVRGVQFSAILENLAAAD